MKAAIFIGGHGKRLGALAADRPKPLVEVAGKSIVDWQIDWLKTCGIKSIVFLTGKNSEKVLEHAQNKSNWGLNVEFVQEIPDANTGGALKCAEKNLKGEKFFYVINGDTLSNIPLKKLRPGKYVAATALVNEPSPFGIIKAKGNKVIEFTEKPLLKNIWINTGFVVATPAIFDYLPERGDMSKITMENLAKLGLLGCKKFRNFYWRDLGTMKDLELAAKDIQDGTLKF
jgi:NDP-sugar pyrophosphorylase family protein